MEKMIIDERNGWEYELKGDYYYPTGRVQKGGVMTPSELPENNGPGEGAPIGIWGQRHLNHIRQHNKPLYLELSLSGKMSTYLADVNAQAEDLFLRTVKEMAMREGATEKLKTKNQMHWVRKMNNICNRAQELVNKELIIS